MSSRGLLVCMHAAVGILHGEFLQGREVTSNPVQPRLALTGGAVEFDLVGNRIAQNSWPPVKRRIVQDDMQGRCSLYHIFVFHSS